MSVVDAYPLRLDLKTYQGDTWVLTFVTEWAASKLDIATFTIRDEPNGTLVMSINSDDESGQFDVASDNEVVVTVNYADSDDIDGGVYWYDLELEDTGNERKTAAFGQLFVQGDISYEDGGGATLATATVQRRLIAWSQGQNYEVTSATANSTYPYLIASGTVKWPDGSAGTLTYTNLNTTWNVYDGYTISHTNSGLTVTQSAVTRNSSGAVTTKPALTVA
jgi:hypothetical protein